MIWYGIWYFILLFFNPQNHDTASASVLGSSMLYLLKLFWFFKQKCFTIPDQISYVPCFIQGFQCEWMVYSDIYIFYTHSLFQDHILRIALRTNRVVSVDGLQSTKDSSIQVCVNLESTMYTGVKRPLPTNVKITRSLQNSEWAGYFRRKWVNQRALV